MKLKSRDRAGRALGQYYRAHETARADEVDGMPLAGFLQRAVGFGVDFFLVHQLQKPVEILWKATIPPAWERHTLIDLLHVRELFVLVLYFSLTLYLSNGKTVGKWLTRTRVLSLTHPQLTFWQSVERALGYGASFLEAGFGFVQFFLNRNRQCVHDRIAETIVVDLRKSNRIATALAPLAPVSP
jgi:uncharacterized RDD family membrane protein YckC